MTGQGQPGGDRSLTMAACGYLGKGGRTGRTVTAAIKYTLSASAHV